MNHIAQTKGLSKELNPFFSGIRSLDRSLKRTITEFTEEELVENRHEIEDISSMISNSTKWDHLSFCKNRISDMLLRVIAKRRDMKNIIFSL